MEGMLWMVAVAGIITLAMRWLLLRGLSPMSRQAVRQLFMERVIAATADSCQLIHDDGQTLTMQCGPSTCTIHFEALYRCCVEAPYRTLLFVREAVQALQAALQDTGRLPADWEDRVMPLLIAGELPVPSDLLQQPLTDTLRVGYVLDGEEAFRWIVQADLQDANTDAARVHALALRNIERSCSGLVIEAPPPQADGHDRLLRFDTRDGLDAARVLVPSFYRRFAPRFGDADLVVAIPTRDTLIAIPATDQAQASFLQWRADTERRHSPHPLAAQLLHISEDDIKEWTSETAEPAAEGVID